MKKNKKSKKLGGNTSGGIKSSGSLRFLN